MKTFITILLIVYILYYGGNILYDLFLKKEKNIGDEDEGKQEISLEHLAQTEVVNVEEEDVETLTTTSSMEMDESQIFSENSEPDMETLKNKYEEEIQEDKIKEPSPVKEELTEMDIEKAIIEKQKDIQEIMKHAETQIQVVQMPNGSKVFKSTIL